MVGMPEFYSLPPIPQYRIHRTGCVKHKHDNRDESACRSLTAVMYFEVAAITASPVVVIGHGRRYRFDDRAAAQPPYPWKKTARFSQRLAVPDRVTLQRCFVNTIDPGVHSPDSYTVGYASSRQAQCKGSSKQLSGSWFRAERHGHVKPHFSPGRYITGVTP